MFFKSRLVVATVVMILLFSILLWRIFSLQIVNGKEYQDNYKKPRRGFCVRRLLPPRRRDASTSAGVRGWGCAEPAETAERVSVCIRYRPFLGRTSAGAGGLSRRGRGGDLWSVRLYAALVRFMPDFRRCRGAVCLQKRVFKNSK